MGLLKQIIIISAICCNNVFSQKSIVKSKSGDLEVGLRNTISLFENDGYSGLGVGGQFRLWLGNKLNTEWYTDYITTNIGNLGNRSTIHIGWSVMFYPFNSDYKLSPYLLAGHCFDYSKITIYDELNTNKERKSSAIQIGLGNSFRLSDRFDISLSAQYMMHIGDDIHTYENIVNGDKQLSFVSHTNSHTHETDGLGVEGHILITASLNFKLIDLW